MHPPSRRRFHHTVQVSQGQGNSSSSAALSHTQRSGRAVHANGRRTVANPLSNPSSYTYGAVTVSDVQAGRRGMHLMLVLRWCARFGTMKPDRVGHAPRGVRLSVLLIAAPHPSRL
jgi:hypothetical protein